MYVFLDVFPLLAFPVLIYNFLVLTRISGPSDQVASWLGGTVFTINAFSGDAWGVSTGDLLIIIALLFLFVEIVKSTRTDAISLINHGLAALAFILFLLEFLIVRGFTTSVFFFLVVMQLIDVVAGYTVTAVAAKRDFGSSGGIIGTN